MSVTFSPRGIPTDWDDDDSFLNVSNVNARDLLVSLELDSEDLYGSIRGRDLMQACDAYLASDLKDPGLFGVHEGNYHFMGRAPGYLPEKVRRLRRIAEAAGDLGYVSWG